MRKELAAQANMIERKTAEYNRVEEEQQQKRDELV